MLPIVIPKRADMKGGLWAPRAFGEFEEGSDDTDFYISGNAEIKELQGSMKLFFYNVKIMLRKSPEDKLHDKASDPAMENDNDNRANESTGENKSDDEANDTVDNNNEENNQNNFEVKVNQKKEIKEEVVYDNPDITFLHLFFTKKNPKTRMVDIHKRGTKIYLNRYNPEGHFGKKGTLNDFEVSLKSIPDVLIYRGLVVVKLPGDYPVSEDPVVYGFIKLQSAKSLSINTVNEMHFSEINDVISRATGGQNTIAEDGSVQKKKNSDRVKPLRFYRKIVKKAWLHFNLRDGDEVNLKMLMKILEYLNIFLLDIQAQRILEAVDIEGDRELGMSEMVNFLMAYDLLGPTANIDCLDIYDTLKVKASNKGYGQNISGGLDFSGFCEAVHMLGVRADEEDMMKAFCSSSGVLEKDVGDAFIDIQSFKKGWIKLAHVSDEMKARNMESEVGLLGAGRNRDRLFRYYETVHNTQIFTLSCVINT